MMAATSVMFTAGHQCIGVFGEAERVGCKDELPGHEQTQVQRPLSAAPAGL